MQAQKSCWPATQTRGPEPQLLGELGGLWAGAMGQRAPGKPTMQTHTAGGEAKLTAVVGYVRTHYSHRSTWSKAWVYGATALRVGPTASQLGLGLCDRALSCGQLKEKHPSGVPSAMLMPYRIPSHLWLPFYKISLRAQARKGAVWADVPTRGNRRLGWLLRERNREADTLIRSLRSLQGSRCRSM